jgi:ABC-type tungstate transport system substrate-binding protein
MNLTSYSVTAYLVLLLVFGILDIFLSRYFRSPGRAYARKMLLRGFAWVILSLSFLLLFRRGILGTWTVFITVGVLVLGNEYLLIWIEKSFFGKDATQAPPTLQQTWSETRARGKRRFLLIGIAVYGFGLLWLAILMKIILLESFPLYLVPASMVGGAVWGYFEGAGEWTRNEREYLKVKDVGHDAA